MSNSICLAIARLYSWPGWTPSFLLIEIFTDFLVPLLLTFLSLKKYLLIFIVFLNKLLFKSVILALSCMTCLVALKSSTLNIPGSLCPLYCIVLNNWQDWTVNEFNLCSWIFFNYVYSSVKLFYNLVYCCLSTVSQFNEFSLFNCQVTCSWPQIKLRQRSKSSILRSICSWK